MNDPLAQFRKAATGQPPAATGPKGGNDYIAFGSKDRVVRLRIRPVGRPRHAPLYTLLANVIQEDPEGTNFGLYYGFMMVLVRGSNLQSLIFAIETGMADFIQEFDSTRWAKPADPAAPFIESIEVIVQENVGSPVGEDPTKH